MPDSSSDDLIVNKKLVVSQRIRIPLKELEFQFVRSSGPGGQNVNKTASKAQLFWNVAESEAIGRDLKLRFLQHYQNRISQHGVLLLESQRYRDRLSNQRDCLYKLRNLLKGIASPPKKRKATKPTRSSVQKRLTNKTQASQKKKLRRPPRGDDA